MAKAVRVAIIATSNDALGDSGQKTGTWLEELATPYYALKDGGAEVILASVAGGQIPFDPRSLEEDDKTESVQRFLKDEAALDGARNSVPAKDLDHGSLDAIFLPGGHGAMWDMPGDAALADVVSKMIEARKIVSAVCHGPAGFIGAKRKDGRPVVEGRRVNAFTNEEEEKLGLSEIVPFSLETRLRELGAYFEQEDAFEPFVLRDGNLITGQNPMSSAKVAEAILSALREREAV